MSNETIARCYKRVRRIKRSVKVKIPVLWSIGLQWRSSVRGVLAVAAQIAVVVAEDQDEMSGAHRSSCSQMAVVEGTDSRAVQLGEQGAAVLVVVPADPAGGGAAGGAAGEVEQKPGGSVAATAHAGAAQAVVGVECYAAAVAEAHTPAGRHWMHTRAVRRLTRLEECTVRV